MLRLLPVLFNIFVDIDITILTIAVDHFGSKLNRIWETESFGLKMTKTCKAIEVTTSVILDKQMLPL